MKKREVLHNSFQSLNEYNAVASNHLHGKRSIALSMYISTVRTVPVCIVEHPTLYNRYIRTGGLSKSVQLCKI